MTRAPDSDQYRETVLREADEMECVTRRLGDYERHVVQPEHTWGVWAIAVACIVALLLAVVLSGCGGGTEPTTNPDGTSTDKTPRCTDPYGVTGACT